MAYISSIGFYCGYLTLFSITGYEHLTVLVLTHLAIWKLSQQGGGTCTVQESHYVTDMHRVIDDNPLTNTCVLKINNVYMYIVLAMAQARLSQISLLPNDIPDCAFIIKEMLTLW